MMSNLGAGSLIIAGNTEEALAWLEKAVALEPDEIAVLYNTTCVYAELGMIDEAELMVTFKPSHHET